jgi:hypothetical protein
VNARTAARNHVAARTTAARPALAIQSPGPRTKPAPAPSPTALGAARGIAAATAA